MENRDFRAGVKDFQPRCQPAQSRRRFGGQRRIVRARSLGAAANRINRRRFVASHPAVYKRHPVPSVRVRIYIYICLRAIAEAVSRRKGVFIRVCWRNDGDGDWREVGTGSRRSSKRSTRSRAATICDGRSLIRAPSLSLPLWSCLWSPGVWVLG